MLKVVLVEARRLECQRGKVVKGIQVSGTRQDPQWYTRKLYCRKLVISVALDLSTYLVLIKYYFNPYLYK